MVGRITSGKSLYGVLAYNRLKVDGNQARVIFCNRMLPPGGDPARLTAAHCRRVMQTWLDAKKNSRFVETIFHASLNPHPEDRLSEQQLADIAEEYMQRMGYGDQPYVVYLHRDIARAHLHIVSVRVGPDGQKIDDGNERYRSKAITRSIEKEYGLRRATKRQEREGTVPLRKVEYRRSDLKAQIASVVRNVTDRYKFCSLKEYNSILQLFRVEAEEVRGEIGGRPYAGILYSALDENGDKVGVPIKSSAIGRDTGIGAIEKHYAKSAEWLKKNTDGMEGLRGIVRDAMRRSRSLPERHDLLPKHPRPHVALRKLRHAAFDALASDGTGQIHVRQRTYGRSIRNSRIQKRPDDRRSRSPHRRRDRTRTDDQRTETGQSAR